MVDGVTTAVALGPEGSIILIGVLWPIAVGVLVYLIRRGNPDNPEQQAAIRRQRPDSRGT
jgi:hypothetical protein